VRSHGARVRRTVAALKANGITVLSATDSADAKRVVLGLIPAGSQVSQGASQSLEASGIAEEINSSGRYEALRPRVFSMDRATQADEIRRLTASPDVMLGSVHAVTETGSLVAASASGSQLGPYTSGAGKVILVVGTQKIVPTLEEALRRIRIRLPARGRTSSGCVRRAQRREQNPHHQSRVDLGKSRVDARPHHRRPLR
jgi:L-lactate utilization protein LutC